MEHEHLTQAALNRILAHDRTEDQNRNLLHQLAVCPECYKVGGYLLDLYRSDRLSLAFGPIDADLARSRAEAPHLWEGLKDMPHVRRLSLIQSDRPFVSWGLCELLCRQSKEIASSDASRAVEMTELAVLVADALQDDDPIEAQWLYQLRSYAWAHLGNAYRVSGDFSRAESAFATADQWRDAGEEGVGDALGYGPALLNLKASLRIAQGRYPEALDLLDQAFGQSMILGGDPHLAGRILIKKTYALLESDDLDRAIPVLREAETLIDPEREPRLLLCARHNLLDNLSKAGRFSEAQALLPEVQTLSGSAGSQLDRVRLRWAEGRIAAGLGDVERARLALSEAQREFLDQDIAYDAALVSLELATLLLQQGLTAEVRQLACEMIPIFRAQDVHREALAALAIFQTAAALDSATVELTRDIAAFLVQARHDPEMRFERNA